MRPIDAELFRAAREGDAAGVRRLVTVGANPNAVDPTDIDHGAFFVGLTPLMVAAGSPRSDAATVEALLSAGADPFAVSEGEVTALWYVAGGGTGDSKSMTASMNLQPGHPFWDWGGGDVERMRLLLDAGGDPDETTSNGRSAIGEACSAGDPARVALLIERGAALLPPDVRHAPGVELGEPYRIAPPSYGLAGGRGSCDPDAVPLFRAAQSGSAECVRLILAAGFPMGFRCHGFGAFEFAGSVDVCRVLWDAGLRPQANWGRGYAIARALRGERYVVAEFLLERHSAEDRQSLLNFHLRESAWHRRAPAVKMLLRMGADPTFFDPGWGTVLAVACWQSDSHAEEEGQETREVIEQLVAAGADPNGLARGTTPLHEAVVGDWGSPIAVRALLFAGAMPDALDAKGRTPLIRAAKHAEIECARLLLAAGADPSRRRPDGRSARDIARQRWRQEKKNHPVTNWILRKTFTFPETFWAETREKGLRRAEEMVRLLG